MKTSMLDFDKYCNLLKQWVKDNYPYIIDEKLREEIAQFEDNLYSKEKRNDVNAKKQREEIDKIIKPMINCDEYDVLEYYKKTLQKYGVDEQDIEKFLHFNKDAKVETEPPTYRLYNDHVSDCDVNNKTYYNIVHKIINEILHNLTSVPFEPNISLSKSLQKSPVILHYEKGEFHCCMGISLIEGKERPTMLLSIPENNIPDTDSLAATICHEFGHWLDFSSKGADNYYESCEPAECFADIIGAKLAQNAGYNYEKFIERIAGFIEDLNTPELQKYKKLAQKRYQLINQIYKKRRKNMTKFAYHCSPEGEIKEFEPQVSSHGKAYVYATPNKSLALVFGVNGHNDLWIHPVYDSKEDTCMFIEMSPNALAKYYKNKSAYLYVVNKEEFTESTGWAGEICSPNPVKPLKVEYIEDLEQAILEEQKSGHLTVIPYEQRNNQGENMDEFFAKRSLFFILRRNDEQYAQKSILHIKGQENKEIYHKFKEQLKCYLDNFNNKKKVVICI